MKCPRLLSAALAVSCSLLLVSPARAVVPVDYHAGRYVGTLQMITTDSSDAFLRTSSTIRLRGRSTGTKTLRLVGTPQIVMPVLPATDDYPMKVFALREGPGIDAPNVYLAETPSMDTNGSSGFSQAVNSQTVTANSITVRLNYQRTFDSIVFDVQVVIRLRRITP